jgi:hypothetical protein
MKITGPAIGVYAVVCPRCNAQIGFACTTAPFGGDRVAHAARYRTSTVRGFEEQVELENKVRAETKEKS